jgi:hypothetical protein
MFGGEVSAEFHAGDPDTTPENVLLAVEGGLTNDGS